MKFKNLILTVVFISIFLSLFTINCSFVVDAGTHYDEDIYTYSVSDGNAIIKSCNKTVEGDIVIPKTLGGYPVVEIGYLSFSNCNSITGITIPDGVKKISNAAFRFCKNLETISLPDSITTIGQYAFDDTAYILKESNWKNGVLYIDNFLIDTKKDITGSYTVKSGTKSIAYYAFAQCKKITNVNLPDTVVYIGRYAFDGCISLKNIKFSSNIYQIGIRAFQDCTSLNNLYLPNKLKKISEFSFVGCKNIETLFLGDSIKKIPDYAFSGCNKLRTVYVPKTVTSIGYNSFDECFKIQNVFYSGTKSEWNNITSADGNGDLYHGKLHTESSKIGHVYDDKGICEICGKNAPKAESKPQQTQSNNPTNSNVSQSTSNQENSDNSSENSSIDNTQTNNNSSITETNTSKDNISGEIIETKPENNSEENTTIVKSNKDLTLLWALLFDLIEIIIIGIIVIILCKKGIIKIGK